MVAEGLGWRSLLLIARVLIALPLDSTMRSQHTLKRHKIGHNELILEISTNIIGFTNTIFSTATRKCSSIISFFIFERYIFAKAYRLG